jgi:hypothetical protein
VSTGEHLTELALARLGLNGDEPPAHVAKCAHCREAVEQLRAEATRFASHVLPRTLPAVEARLAPRRMAWWRAAACAAVAAAVLMWLATRHDLPPAGQPVIAAKGEPALHLVARRTVGGQDRVFGVEPGTELAAGDAVRIVLDGAAGHHLLVISVDRAGQISVYYPYGGEASAQIEPRDHVVLDGSIVLDDAPGPERIWAVVSHRVVTVAELRQQLAAIAAGGAAAIRVSTELAIPDARQATTWFEKSSPSRVERIP